MTLMFLYRYCYRYSSRPCILEP